MNANVNYNIMKLFDNIDDMLNCFVDRLELTPIQITKNCYITGFRRTSAAYADIDVHLKEIRKIKIEGLNTSVTDEGGWLMMEPDGEIWVNSTMLTDTTLNQALQHFTKKMGEINTYHIMMSKWKDEKDEFPHVEVTLFENKRVACKEALNMRKKHQNVSNKFEMYNNQGELLSFTTETQQKQHEPTDFELVTCATQ